MVCWYTCREHKENWYQCDTEELPQIVKYGQPMWLAAELRNGYWLYYHWEYGWTYFNDKPKYLGNCERKNRGLW